MREMLYRKDYRCYILDKGNYKGLNYAIVSYGTHPCSYIFLPKGHKFYGKNYEEINDYFIDGLCHCGLTFSESDLCFNPLPNDCWVIGWDYSHCCDYSGIYIGDEVFNELKKWTTEELIEEVKQVIDELEKEND